MSDEFIDLPKSAQALYLFVGVDADDDGFVGRAKSLLRQVNATEEDLNALIEAGFLLNMDGKIFVVTHWRINNQIRSDRYKPTRYDSLVRRLFLNRDKSYSLDDTNGGIPLVYQVDTNGIPTVDKRETQYSIGKDSIGKTSSGECREGEGTGEETPKNFLPELKTEPVKANGTQDRNASGSDFSREEWETQRRNQMNKVLEWKG